MSRNPEFTKQHITHVAGMLFNKQGYKATSLSDITTASGYTKGAIYKHFGNKQNLEKQALIYLCTLVTNEIAKTVRREKTAPEKLRAIFRFYTSYSTHPIVDGGCPLMNASIETDDTNQELKMVVVKVMDVIQSSIVHILHNGIKHKQLNADVPCEEFALFIISSLEGAIMMSQLYNNNQALQNVYDYLNNQLDDYILHAM